MILVIEDNASERVLIRKMLEAEGYQVREAADGDQGVAQFRAARPSLVVCDLMMPVKDGYETIKEIQAIAPDIKVVVISGFLYGIDHAAMRENLGVAAIIEKPFRQAHLIEVVRNVMAVER